MSEARSAEHELPSLDATYSELIADLPTELHAAARSLPYRLGISRSPRLGWDDYSQLAPMRELPGFASEGAANGRVDAGDWIVAHRAAGFYLVLVDRVCDGQVSLDGELRRLRAALRARWVSAAHRAAAGDARFVEARVARSIRRHRRGVRRERLAFARGSLSPTEYARIVRDKTDPLLVASELLLERVATDRVVPFGAAFDSMMLSLQLFDDALDAAEDREVRGASVCELLGCHDEALFVASARLAEIAAARAAEAGFLMLASFLEERSRARLPARDAFLDAMGAWLIVGELGASAR